MNYRSFEYGGSFYGQLCKKIEYFSSFDFVRREQAGRSVGGRELHYLHLGGDDLVFIMAGTHPLEYITTALLCDWLAQLCRAIAANRQLHGFDVKEIFTQRGIVILPCHNPDGTEIAFGDGDLSGADALAVEKICNGDPSVFNCNLNGVDLNHNFDAGWELMRAAERAAGIDGPSPRRYGGPSPCSEPENIAVVKLCEKYGFRQALALHSQGEEIYWKYGDSLPPYSEIMAHVLALSCGYKLVTQEGMASHGGFKDWFITKYNRPAFTVEVGLGKNPLPLSMLKAVSRRLSKTLLIASIM